MKILFKIGLFFLLPLSISAQQPKLDSLHQALKMPANDSIRMELLNGFYLYYAESNRDSAMFYTDLALAKSKEIKQTLWTAYILVNKAYLLLWQGNLSLSFKLLNESMSIAQDEKSEENVFFPASIKSVWHNPHEGRLFILGGVFHNLGNAYWKAGDTVKAILSYKEVIRITEGNKEKNSFLHASMNIGSIYLDLNQLDSAMRYSRNALVYSNSSSNKTYQGNMLKKLGDIYAKQNQLDSAKFYYWRSIIVSREQNNITSEIVANIALAQLYDGMAQTDSVFYYANAAFRMSTNLKMGAQTVTSAGLISNAFKRIGSPDSALTYLSISKTISDSLNKARTEKLMEFQNTGFEEQMQFEKTTQESVAFKNKIRTGLLLGGLAVFSLIAVILYRNNRQKQKANSILETTLTNLKQAQAQLIQSEKMASLGELTAGIAHEIQNPLNFVNNFSEVSNEMIDEMKIEFKKGDTAEGFAIVDDIKKNLEKILHHGKRADAIVKGMLQHSRTSGLTKEPTDINKLTDEYLRLAYHGLRAKDNSFNATLKTDFDESLSADQAGIGKINIIPQDIGRVLLNLIINAFYAVGEKKKSGIAGYEPTVSISTKRTGKAVEMKVTDNGNGIPENMITKIFQPFFTTKPTGQGTGLGLSLAYDIVKAHGGDLSVKSENGAGRNSLLR